MTQAIGAKSRIIYQQETTFKTTPATPNANLLYFETESFQSTRNLIDSKTIRGSRDATKPIIGNKDVKGTIKTELQAYIGTLLKGALGNVVTVGTAVPYTHTITVGSLPTFTIEKGFTDIGEYFLYNGCKVNKLDLTVSPEGFQNLSLDFVGARETASTTSYDSTPNDLTKVSWTGFNIAYIKEGGTPIATVTEVTLSIENNLDASVYVIGGQGERYSLPEGIIKVSGKIKALFDGMSLLQKAMNSQTSSLEISYSLGTGDGSSGNEALDILIPELIYSPVSPAIAGPSGVFIDLPFEAFYSTNATGSSIQMVLKCTQATL
jgi:hypothetical protein